MELSQGVPLSSASRRDVIELLIKGKLAIEAEGQLELPKQPPFDVLTPGWAVKATVQLGDGDPNLVRLFDAWYFQGWEVDVRAGDGRGRVGVGDDAVRRDGPAAGAAGDAGVGPAAAPARTGMPYRAEPALPAHHEVDVHLRAGGGALRVVRGAGVFKREMVVEAVN